jgi:hypothetical protein
LPRIDARAACSLVLAEYLRALEFMRWGGPTGTDTYFKLEAVREEWPEPDVAMTYPSASIVDMGQGTALEGHGLLPTPLEETYEQFSPGTVLWKLHEAAFDFQVDFWADDSATREAIAGRLPSAFSPGEDGSRVVLCGSPLYFDRPVRASLSRYQRMDVAEAVYPRERRLMATVRCEVDVVDLRCVALLSQTTEVRAVGEEVELDVEPDLEPALCK